MTKTVALGALLGVGLIGALHVKSLGDESFAACAASRVSAGTRGPANATVRKGYAGKVADASRGPFWPEITAFSQANDIFRSLLAPVDNGATVASFQIVAPVRPTTPPKCRSQVTALLPLGLSSQHRGDFNGSPTALSTGVEISVENH